MVIDHLRLTPEARKQNKHIGACTTLGSNSYNTNDQARDPHQGRSAAGHAATTKSIDSKDSQDNDDYLQGRSDGLDLEGVGQASLLEEVGTKATKEGKTQELLRNKGPHGGDGTAAVGALKDSQPAFVSLLGRQSLFVFDVQGEEFIVAIDIKIFDSTVEKPDTLLGPLFLSDSDTPGRRFGK